MFKKEKEEKVEEKNSSYAEAKDMAISYKASMSYLMEKSNKRAWLVSFVFGFIAIISVVAVCFLTPLKEVKPYVIRVDNTTGYAEVLTDVKKDIQGSEEALSRYFLKDYIDKREGYNSDFFSLDYKTVGLMSTPEVFEAYKNYIARSGILEDFNTEFIVKPKILTISFDSKNYAIIRFERYVGRKSRPAEDMTLEGTYILYVNFYFFNDDLPLSNNDRLLNPLAFTVNGYRMEKER